MHLSPKAQSSVEYALIIAFVIGGIMAVGPYVIRSINAQFEAIEDDAHESFHEVPKQGPLISETLPGCECGAPVDSGACGTGLNCPPTQRVWNKVCNPAGCAALLISRFGLLPYECRDDPRCCLETFTGLCGPNAIHVLGGCPDGEGEYLRECGNPPVYSYLCKDPTADPINPINPNPCIFNCIGGLGLYAQWCDAAQHDKRLMANTQTVFYDASSGCPADLRCAALCYPTFVQDPPGPNPPNKGVRCVCPPGYVGVDAACAAACPNACCQGSCGASQCEYFP